MFRRTSSGLSNQHLFQGADLLVFVEGGKSYSVKEVYEGRFNDDSRDIRFWSNLFSHFYKSKKIIFKAVGSKETLIDIATDIQKGKIINVYVAMDRDFDSINNKLIQAKGVFYTHGYSWENDVWHPEIVQDVFSSLCSVGGASLDIVPKILSLCEKFSKEMKFAVYADAFLHVKKSNAAFIPRDRHLRLLIIRNNFPPEADLKKIEEIFRQCSLTKTDVEKFGKRHKINTLRDCYGHLLFDFAYFMISHFLTKICNLPSVAKHYVNNIGIDKFFLRFSDGKFPILSDYYQEYFSVG